MRQTMTNKDMFDDAFPQDKQIGGSHYKHFHIQPYEFISKNELSFFQGNVIKYTGTRMFTKGDPKENIKKAIWYLNKMLQLLEKKS